MRGRVVPDTAKADRMLKALGYDPRLFALVAKRGGLGIVDRDGAKPVQFLTPKQLKARGRDPVFLRAWEAAA